MAWFKRNLFFVLSMLAGLILTGYCAWLFAGNLSANSDVKKEMDDDDLQYEQLQSKVPYPSAENINRAKEDTSHAKEFVDEMRKSFASFPAPPHEDEQGFSAYLEDTITDLRTKATNAEVILPPDFAFGFTDRLNKLNQPPEAIQPWMEQLTEIKVLCNIFYAAKINSLASFRRVSVSDNDVFTVPNDTFPAKIITTPLQTVTPYKIDIRCFTRELAAVMEGLARSSNCFIVKNIVVKPAAQDAVEAPPMAPNPGQPPPPPPEPDRRPGETQAHFNAVMEAYQKRLEKAAEIARDRAMGMTPGGAVTVEREHLLFITLSVDAVKFKGADH